MILCVEFTYANEVHPDCLRWFKKSNVNPNDKNCDIQCASIAVNMGTFSCPLSCPKLCGEPKYKTPLGKVCDKEFFYGITNPKKVKRIMEIQQEAVKKTKQVFNRNAEGDHSDAFRHYYGSALLTREFGETEAKKITNNHEACMSETLDSNMDLHNNQLGIEAAVKHSGELQLIIQQAKTHFKEEHFKIYKPMVDFTVEDYEWR
jgi:hypothetical protein